MNSFLCKAAKNLFPLLGVALLIACGNGGSDTNAGQEDSGSSTTVGSSATSGKAFDKSISKEGCDILTIDMVSEVAGVPVSDIEEKRSRTTCRFSWEGGQAFLVSLRTSGTPEYARQSFENSYTTKTGDEVAAQLDDVADQVEKQSDEGKTDVDPDQARQVTDSMASVFGGGMIFEPIEGLGDEASFETTRSEVKAGGNTYVSYANSLTVLTGNLVYTVHFSRGDGSTMFPVEAEALARAVQEVLDDY